MADIEAFRARLTGAGFPISEEARHAEAFGSWHITVDTRPASQLVWDGKDRWLILRSGGEDVWIARDSTEQTPDAVIDQLRLLDTS